MHYFTHVLRHIAEQITFYCLEGHILLETNPRTVLASHCKGATSSAAAADNTSRVVPSKRKGQAPSLHLHGNGGDDTESYPLARILEVTG